jgi:hypothetical protein
MAVSLGLPVQSTGKNELAWLNLAAATLLA